MKRDKIAMMEDILKSFQNRKQRVLNDINWDINSDDSFHIGKVEFMKKIDELSLVSISIEQTEFFLEQLRAIEKENDLDSEDDLPDSTDS